MNLIDTSKITEWQKATKTKNLRARHISSVVSDETLFSKFLLETLEGNEPLAKNAMVCLGSAGDVWQQDPAKLLKKYDIIGIASNGWFDCKPKPGNLSNCCIVTAEIAVSDKGILPACVRKESHALVGTYGERSQYGLLQYANIGDYILQDPGNLEDCWIVAAKIFANTYDIVP